MVEVEQFRLSRREQHVEVNGRAAPQAVKPIRMPVPGRRTELNRGIGVTWRRELPSRDTWTGWNAISRGRHESSIGRPWQIGLWRPCELVLGETGVQSTLSSSGPRRHTGDTGSVQGQLAATIASPRAP